MTDHVHLVVKPFRVMIRRLVIQLKGAATRRLLEAGLHPFQNDRDPDGGVPKAFGRGEWKVFLDTVADMQAGDPVRRGQPREGRQTTAAWSFVVPFDG